MRVLVTGGAGYIGSVTSRALLAAGHDVVVFDSLRTGHRDAVAPGADFVLGDIRDRDALDGVLDGGGIDACIHFAALIEAGESMAAPERFFAVNSGGSANLLQALVEHDIERFVLSSTAAVYGEPVTVPIPETHPLDPTNAYGESKLLVERMLSWLHRQRGFRYAALRYFNAAGAVDDAGERHEPESHLIPLVLQVAEGTREDIAMFGTDYDTPDGTCIRDYIHVADLAAAHVAALSRLDDLGSIITNVGTGSGFSVREVIESARRVTGHAIPAREAPRRDGDPARLVAGVDRAAELLDWRAEVTDLDDIVASAWDFRMQLSARSTA